MNKEQTVATIKEWLDRKSFDYSNISVGFTDNRDEAIIKVYR